MPNDHRNHSLDALRLLAALCVVALHVGGIDSVDDGWNLVRVEMRWAVPFFFILTGLHLGSDLPQMPSRIALLIPRLMRVLLFASLLFLPVLIISLGFRGALQQVFSFDFLRSGSYFHLWFISAFIVGLLILQTALLSGASRMLVHVSALLIVLALLSGSYSVVLPPGHGLEGNFTFFRHLLSVPCLYLGIVLARSPAMTDRFALALAIGGAVLQALEAIALRQYADVSLFSHQFLLGTLPMTVGLVALARNHTGAITGRLANWGRRHSLGIYIVHPLWMLMFADLLMPSDILDRSAGPMFVTLVIFGASLASMLAFDWLKQMAAASGPARNVKGGLDAIRLWLPR